MMNNARLSVGLQGVAIADRAYQHAVHYAADRVQGKDFDSGERTAIEAHPDVQRNLLTMKSQIEAGRAMTYQAALALDSGDRGMADLLTPIVKSWCTDMACEVTSIGVQIHGGMGFVEETGAAQYFRDARILPIYEGTNGIQSADLVFRKTLRDGGEAAKSYIHSLKSGLHTDHAADFDALLESLDEVTETLVKAGKDGDMKRLAFAGQPYLKAFGIIAGGALLSRSVKALDGIDDKDFAAEKARTADFFIGHILPLATGYLISASRT